MRLNVILYNFRKDRMIEAYVVPAVLFGLLVILVLALAIRRFCCESRHRNEPKQPLRGDTSPPPPYHSVIVFDDGMPPPPPYHSLSSITNVCDR